jgi:peptidyl-prolyl cis-trans isomerase B (cyclophilin B)
VTNPPPYGEYPPPEPGYYGNPGVPGYGYPPRGTNGMAVASLVCAFLFFPLGIVFGRTSGWYLMR